jgi:hypothetical protein
MKNKGLSILLLLLGGAAVYYIIKNKKPKLKGSVIIDPLDKGEFVPDVAKNVVTTEKLVTQLNSEMQTQPSILSQIKNMKPIDAITYQTYYGKGSDAEQNNSSYQTMYANIGGQKMCVPYCV